MNIVVLIGAIGIIAIGGYFAFRERIFTSRPKPPIVEVYPYNVDKISTEAFTHLQKGMSFALKRQFEAALSEYESALEICPDHKGILFYLAHVFIGMKRFSDAKDVVRALIDDNPVDSLALYLRGLVYHHQENFAAAVTDYNSALHQQIYLVQPYLSRAKLHLTIKNYEKAQDDIDWAMQLAPENTFVWMTQGFNDLVLGNKESAILNFEKAINFDENNVEAIYHYAHALLGRGEISKADEQITRALDIAPDYVDAQVVKADILRLQKSWDDALTYYLKAIKHITDFHIASYINMLISSCYLQLRKYEETIASAQRAIEQNPLQLPAYNNRGFAYFKFKNYDLALADYNRAIKLNPNAPTAYIYRGSLYSRLGKYQQALESQNQAIELQPNSSYAYNNRAWTKASFDDYQGSLDDANKAVELDADYSYARGTRGQARWLLGDYEGALADYEAAVELDPKDDVFVVEKAVVLYKLNRKDEAIAAWKKLADFDDEPQTADELQEKYYFADPFYQALKEIEVLAKDNL